MAFGNVSRESSSSSTTSLSATATTGRTSLRGKGDSKVASELEKKVEREVKKLYPPRMTFNPNESIQELNDYHAMYMKKAAESLQKLQFKVNAASGGSALKLGTKIDTLIQHIETAKAQKEGLEQLQTDEKASMREELRKAGLPDDVIEQMMNERLSAPMHTDAELEELFRPIATSQDPQSAEMAAAAPEVDTPNELEDWIKKSEVKSDKLDTQALLKGKIGATGLSENSRNDAVALFKENLHGAEETPGIKKLLSKVKDGSAKQEDINKLRDQILIARNLFKTQNS